MTRRLSNVRLHSSTTSCVTHMPRVSASAGDRSCSTALSLASRGSASRAGS